jgi:hypothetical protein
MTLFSRAVDLYNQRKTPEQVRSLFREINEFVTLSQRFARGKVSFWQWRRALEKVKKEMEK